MIHYDVIIIGAGPTGLMAANQLARFGINFLIIDSKDGPTVQSRAIVITARSMEIYQQLGISDEAIEGGRFITDFSIIVNGKEKATATIGEFGKGLTDFSYMLAFEQSRNEKLLTKNLAALSHQVSWNTQLEHIEQRGELIEADLKYLSKPGEPIEKVTANYVIGCDGAKSVVRHAFDFSFKGGTYEQLFYVADTKLKWQEGLNKLVLFPSRQVFCGFFPMAGTNSHRIIGTIPSSFADPEKVTFNDLEKTIRDVVKIPLEIEAVNWFSIYKLHHRSVNSFSKGNCFLAGDAGHIHSPAGGQGMNTGLMDAYNLSWKLALVIKKIADKKLLNSYNEERLPFAQWLLKFTDRFFGIMTSNNIFISWFRNNIVPFIMRFFLKRGGTRTTMFKTLSQTSWSYHKSSVSQNRSTQKLQFKAGDRLPYVLTGPGRQSVYKLLTAPAFHLLLIGDGLSAPTLVHPLIKSVHFPLEEWAAQGVSKPLYILVRPDNYIGLISDEMNGTVLDNYLKQHCYFVS